MNGNRVSGIVAITGAGISIASGLPTVRAELCGVGLSEMFSRRYFMRDRQGFLFRYKRMVETWTSALPNAAHLALARIGSRIITQNVDGLHQRAGSSEVIELHGNLRTMWCTYCATRYDAMDIARGNIPDQCGICGHGLRPDYVFLGEGVRRFAEAVDWVSECRTLLVVGTRLAMEPVRELPGVAARAGAQVCHLHAPAEQHIPQVLSELVQAKRALARGRG